MCHARLRLSFSGSFGSSFPTFPISPVANPRYYAQLRLPTSRLEVLRCSLVPRYLLPVSSASCSRIGLIRRRDTSALDAGRVFFAGSPTAGHSARMTLDLSSSWATPVSACPGLRPRWCLACFAITHARLLPSVTAQCVGFPHQLPGYPLGPPRCYLSGLNTQPADSLHPASDTASRRSPSGSLLACWLGFGLAGLAPAG